MVFSTRFCGSSSEDILVVPKVVDCIVIQERGGDIGWSQAAWPKDSFRIRDVTTGVLDSDGEKVSGVVTATSFSGSGANLTNIPASTDGSFIGLNVTGITTLGDDVRITAGGLNVVGVSTFADIIASSAKISDLTSGRVVYAGASGELQDSANLTFDGTELSAGLIDGGSY